MQQTVHCIALRTVRHSDSTSIVTVWTRERGRMALAVSSANTPEARRRRALMQPFSLFEGVVDVRDGSDISRIKDVRRVGTAPAGADPVKSALAMFLADFLYAVLRESQPDALLADYIADGVRTLAAADRRAAANFHLYFTYGIGRFLGIAPDDATYAADRCFDMREGIYTLVPPVHRDYIPAPEARIVHTLSRLNQRNLGRLRLSRDDRNAILDGILEYYTIHHTPLMQLTSLQILRSLFA